MEDTVESLTARIRAFADEREWQRFHTPRNLAMALSGEVGELLAELQWLSDGEVADHLARDADFAERMQHEVADVFIYLLRFADVTGIDLMKAAADKLDVNATRYPASAARGQATKYTRLGSPTS